MWFFWGRENTAWIFSKQTKSKHRESLSVLQFSHKGKKAYPELEFIFGYSQSEVWHDLKICLAAKASVINTTTTSCCSFKTTHIERVQNCSSTKRCEEKLCQGTAAKIQGIPINSFCCGSAGWAKSLFLPHGQSGYSKQQRIASGASAHHPSHADSATLAHGWVFRNSAIAGFSIFREK